MATKKAAPAKSTKNASKKKSAAPTKSVAVKASRSAMAASDANVTKSAAKAPKGAKAAKAATPAKAPKGAKAAKASTPAKAPRDGKAPKGDSVSAGLAVACAVFDAFGWTYKVDEQPDGVAEVFVNSRGDRTFAGVKAIHYPGRLVLFGAAPFSVPEEQLVEAYTFASHVNNSLQDGCLMVRGPAPAEVTFRTAVNYTRLEALHPNLVTAAIADLVEGAGAVFPGMEAVSSGASADDAYDALG